jgi:hypothetical protein
MQTKNEVFEEHLHEWLRAHNNRKRRREIATHMVFITQCHPKSVSRTFRRLQLRDPAHEERRGRPQYYDTNVIGALRDVWEVSDRSCGENIHPMIEPYITVLTRDNLWKHGDLATNKLRAISLRTTKRIVTKFKREDGMRKHGLSGTSPSLLKNIIPIRKDMSSAGEPGDGQLDTVAHCGDSLAGSFIWTLNYTDASTYWVQIRAQWNKGQEGTKDSVVAIRAQLPFPLTHLHPDSGGEFINWVLKGWCDAEHIELSRSEPYKKNDNMFVEERNGHVIRKYLGWERRDVLAVLPLVNELCDTVCLYTNHWKAVRRMVSKERVGAKYVRTYEPHPQTPYARVMAHARVSAIDKEKLHAVHETLNPLLLLKKIATLKKKIYELTKVTRDDLRDERLG